VKMELDPYSKTTSLLRRITDCGTGAWTIKRKIVVQEPTTPFLQGLNKIKEAQRGN